jgi:chromatin assembly factor 1 subunit B
MILNKLNLQFICKNKQIWEIQHGIIEKMSARFLANLKRHNKGVNALRWSPDGKILASGGDEGVLLLWNENDIKNQKTLDNDEDDNLENWFAFKTLRYFNQS